MYSTKPFAFFDWPWAKRITQSNAQPQGIIIPPGVWGKVPEAQPVAEVHEGGSDCWPLPSEDAFLALQEAMRKNESIQDILAYLARKNLYLCKQS